MIKDLVYNIFIVNAWGIVFITIFYGWIFKTILPKYKKYTPIFCVIFSLIFILCIPHIDSPFSDKITKMSDIIYDILAPVGLYNIVSCISHLFKERKVQNEKNKKQERG